MELSGWDQRIYAGEIPGVCAFGVNMYYRHHFFGGEFRRRAQIEAFILSLKISINIVVLILVVEHMLSTLT